MTIEKITFITPSLPYPNLVSHILMVEYGPPLIATIARNAGYDVQLFAEHVAPIDWDRVLTSDVVGFHTFSSTMPKIIAYTRRIRAARPDMPIIIGGTHASVMVEDTLQYCDYVVRQEGDETLLDLLDTLKNGGDLSRVRGISYKVDGVVRHNLDRPFVERFHTIPDLELVHGYTKVSKLTLLRRLMTRWNVLQTSRGCPFDCAFCIAPRELGRGYRVRDIESVIADIKYQRALTGCRRFFIVDNHFTVNARRTKALLSRIIEERLDWEALCFTRIEVARDPEMLDLLRQAGINTLYIGMESFDDAVLKLLNKSQTRESIRRAIETIHAHGLRVLGSFVLGSDSETVQTIRATVDLAIALDIEYAAFFPLSGYPEEDGRLIPLDRFFFDDWGRLDGCHVVFLPKHMKPSTLQREIHRAYRTFYGPRQILHLLLRRRFREALRRAAYRLWIWEMERSASKWIADLEAREGPYYDANEQLLEDRVEGLVPCQYPGSSRRSGAAPTVTSMPAS